MLALLTGSSTYGSSTTDIVRDNPDLLKQLLAEIRLTLIEFPRLIRQVTPPSATLALAMPCTDSNVTSSNSCRAKNYRWLRRPGHVSASALLVFFLIYILFFFVTSRLPRSTFKNSRSRNFLLSVFLPFYNTDTKITEGNNGCHVRCFSVTSELFSTTKK